jgi:hypothetical protein
VSLPHIGRLGSRSCEFYREEIALVEKKCYLSSLVKPSIFQEEHAVTLNLLCCFLSVVIFSIRHLLTGELVINSCVRSHSLKSDKYGNSGEQERDNSRSCWNHHTKGKSGEYLR